MSNMGKLNNCGKFSYADSSIMKDIAHATVALKDSDTVDLDKSKARSLSAISKTLYNIMCIMDVESEGGG